MADLGELLNELDELRAAKTQAHAAYTQSVDAEHAKIREILATGPRGIRATVIKRTGYTPAHVDRIRRGVSSGNLSPTESESPGS